MLAVFFSLPPPPLLAPVVIYSVQLMTILFDCVYWDLPTLSTLCCIFRVFWHISFGVLCLSACLHTVNRIIVMFHRNISRDIEDADSRERKRIHAAWSIFDRNNTEQVSATEIGPLMRYLGRAPSEEELQTQILPKV